VLETIFAVVASEKLRPLDTKRRFHGETPVLKIFEPREILQRVFFQVWIVEYLYCVHLASKLLVYHPAALCTLVDIHDFPHRRNKILFFAASRDKRREIGKFC